MISDLPLLRGGGLEGGQNFLRRGPNPLFTVLYGRQIKARNLLILDGNNKRLSLCETKSGEESLKVILASKEETSDNMVRFMNICYCFENFDFLYLKYRLTS